MFDEALAVGQPAVVLTVWIWLRCGPARPAALWRTLAGQPARPAAATGSRRSGTLANAWRACRSGREKRCWLGP